MITEIVLFVLGAFASFVVDTWWWLKPTLQKAEKGLEFHEHYHVGLELIILGLALSYVDTVATYIVIGAGFGFIMAEWRQIVEPKNGKVLLGHPFAYGSTHFTSSTVLGVILTGIAVSLVLFKYLQ